MYILRLIKENITENTDESYFSVIMSNLVRGYYHAPLRRLPSEFIDLLVEKYIAYLEERNRGEHRNWKWAAILKEDIHDEHDRESIKEALLKRIAEGGLKINVIEGILKILRDDSYIGLGNKFPRVTPSPTNS